MTRFNYSIEDFDSLTLAQAWKIIHANSDYQSNLLDLLKNEFRTASFFTLRTVTDKLSSPKDVYSIPAIDELIVEREGSEYNPEDFKWIYEEGHLSRP